jgi:hypothetical protein
MGRNRAHHLEQCPSCARAADVTALATPYVTRAPHMNSDILITLCLLSHLRNLYERSSKTPRSGAVDMIEGESQLLGRGDINGLMIMTVN